MSEKNRVRLCVIVTSETSLRFLFRNQFEFLADNGVDVTAVASSPTSGDEAWKDPIPAKFVSIGMRREPSPFFDMISLVRLWWFLVFNRFDIVHVSTPKAGLLGALASFLSGHRNLVYTIRGRVYENAKGVKRRFWAALDSLVCWLSRRVFVISRELRDSVVREGISPRSKTFVLANGSSNGIDLEKYRSSEEMLARSDALKNELGIRANQLVILSIGRIRREKGINELVRAFELAQEQCDNLLLVIAGSRESVDPLDEDVDQAMAENDSIIELGWQNDPEVLYALADVVVFPSYREGFGNVTLEGGAMKLPVIASDIFGPREVITDGENGLLVPPQDHVALCSAMVRLAEDRDLRKRLGANAYRNVSENYSQQLVFEELLHSYLQIVGR